MSKHVLAPTLETHQPNEPTGCQQETILFLEADFKQPDAIIRDGQVVTYEVERRADGRLYATNIEVYAEPSFH
jgi:hypothetical protein